MIIWPSSNSLSSRFHLGKMATNSPWILSFENNIRWSVNAFQRGPFHVLVVFLLPWPLPFIVLFSFTKKKLKLLARPRGGSLTCPRFTWRCSCFFQWSERKNFLLQKEQEKGASSVVWVARKCSRSLSPRLNILPHASQGSFFAATMATESPGCPGCRWHT